MTLVLSGSNGLSDVDGSAATPAIRGTDANTGMFFPAADTIAFAEGGVESMRLDSSGNVGIGTGASALTKTLTVQASEPIIQLVDADLTTRVANIGGQNGNVTIDIDPAATAAASFFAVNIDGAEQARISSAGVLSFNSGYGSSAVAYGVRAWVNFNGTGTVAIRASGNVTSITDNGTGDYTVNLTTAMPDANYAIGVSGAQGTDETNRGLAEVVVAAYTTSSFKLRTGYNVGGNVATDYAIVNAVVLR